MKGQGFRFHHLGMPSPESRAGEVFLPEFGMHVTPLQDDAFRIQWMRFEDDSPLPPLVREVPHLAFQVENLKEALEGRSILIPPNSPSDGVRVAFILHEGAPIEFLEFTGEHPEKLAEEEEATHG
ncbi:MAG: hypothetical protein PVJ76_13745 [Gemmatimonadota bacterium]|jgi:hypothetical protein